MKLRSWDTTRGIERVTHRALYKSMGYSAEDLKKPMIGIANAWSTVVPGHFNLREVSGAVREGIRRGGGTPVEFGVIGACDGISEGHIGTRYILPTRELIANDIEAMVEAHRFDGIVLLGSCDKIVPGMLMAAARLDIPAILVHGGPALGGMFYDGKKSDVTAVDEALGRYQVGEITEERLLEIEDRVMPTCGACSMLGTANSMGCAMFTSTMIPSASLTKVGEAPTEVVGIILPSSKIAVASMTAISRCPRNPHRTCSGTLLRWISWYITAPSLIARLITSPVW